MGPLPPPLNVYIALTEVGGQLRFEWGWEGVPNSLRSGFWTQIEQALAQLLAAGKNGDFGTTFGENIFFGRRFFGSEGIFGHRRVCAVVSARFQEKKVDDRKYF